jgi:hypothetical protein
LVFSIALCARFPNVHIFRILYSFVGDRLPTWLGATPIYLPEADKGRLLFRRPTKAKNFVFPVFVVS